MNTPESDAVKFIYDILKAAMGGGALTALGVKKLILDEPGTPHENYIAVLFGGGEEISSGGLSRITVLVDIRSQELMTGATTNPLTRFKKRIELCRQLIRSGSTGRGVEVEEMSYPMAASEPDTNRKFFYNTTIIVPVIMGGGI